MIIRFLAGAQVDSFYTRFQAHFDAALGQYREEEHQQHGWKQDEVKKHLAESAARLDISLEKMFGVLALAILLQDFFK